jgi:hypothetical protein
MSEPTNEPMLVTTFRVKAAHVAALQTAAIARKLARGSGKADASEVLREVLDAWIAGGKINEHGGDVADTLSTPTKPRRSGPKQ